MGIDSNKVYLTEPDQSPTTGAIQTAKVGTAAPTDARTKLSDAWSGGLGYVGEDGVTVSGLIAAGDAVRDWAKRKIRVTRGEADPTVTIPAVQIDKGLAGFMLHEGDFSVTEATAEHGEVIVLKFSGEPGPANSVCINMKDEDRRVRVYMPSAQVTSIDDVSLKPDEPNKFSMTLSLNADANGYYVYFIYDDGQVVGA